jgi:hypothetical protein
MAKRYGKLPTEILSLDLDEYAINGIILHTALKYEASVHSGNPMVLSRGWDRDESMKAAIDGALFHASNRRVVNMRRRAL